MTALDGDRADDQPTGAEPALIQATERAADALKQVVPPTADLANRVLPDNTRLVRLGCAAVRRLRRRSCCPGS